MFTLKERVSERLSRLFADSPTSAASALPSKAHDENSKVRLYAEASKSKTLSSYFSAIMPSVGGGGSRSCEHQLSAPFSRTFDSQDKPLDTFVECRSPGEAREAEYDQENDDDHASIGSTSGSDVYEEATLQPSSEKHLSYLIDDSVFISLELQEFLLSSLPNIVKGCQWVLMYSTAKHGISLRTLIRKSAEISGPCLLIVGDMQGAVFGGLLEGPLKPSAKRKYQGTNQAFVFTTIYGEPRLFRPTGANRYYYMCLNDLLAFGGGGNFALCLDGDLLSGTSGPCETFGNLCLAHKPEFELKNVELWGFTHASRYVS